MTRQYDLESPNSNPSHEIIPTLGMIWSDLGMGPPQHDPVLFSLMIEMWNQTDTNLERL